MAGKSYLNFIFYFFLGMGILIRMGILHLPLEETLLRWGSDDMFYYSQLAGHFFTHAKLSFDGIHPGSGVQPLFFVLLLPFGKALLNNTGNSVLLLFSLITLLNVFTAIVLRKGISAMMKSRVHGTIVAVLFIVHPKIISICYQGTEAALSLISLSLVLIVWQRIESSQKKLFQNSLVLGLCVMTRLDFCVLLAGMGLISVMQKRISFKALLKLGIIPFVFVLLWTFFIYSQTGNYQPDSAVAKIMHKTFILQNKLYHNGADVVLYLKNFMYSLSLPFKAEQKTSITTLIVLLIGAILLVKDKKYVPKTLAKRIYFPFLGGSIIHLVILISLFCYYREWYVMPFFILFCLLMGGVIDLIMGVSKVRYLLFPLLCLISLGWWIEANTYPRSFLTDREFKILHWTKENIPKGVKVGAFNAGLYGSYLNQNTVTNLDGLVNHSILESYQRQELDKYIYDQQIEYIIDRTESIEFYSKMAGAKLIQGLEPIKEFKLSEAKKFGIYKVKKMPL